VDNLTPIWRRMRTGYDDYYMGAPWVDGQTKGECVSTLTLY